MKTKIILLLLFINAFATNAQDATFAQFNSVPLYFNPSFAGLAEKSRLALSYRNQWNSNYQTGYISYDQAVKRIHGGLGLIAFDDNSGNGILNRFYAGVVYAAKFNILNKIAITPGIKLGYRRTSVDENKLTFGNQIDPKNGFVYPSGEQFKINNAFDLSAGLLVNTEKLYIGFAVDHINQPNESILVGGKSSLPMKQIYQAGYVFQKDDNSNFAISTSAIYQRQGQFDVWQANISARYKWVVVGVAYSSTAIYTGMIGYHSKKIEIAYTYDYFKNAHVNELTNTSIQQVAHEVSLKYFFTLSKKKKEAEIKS